MRQQCWLFYIWIKFKPVSLRPIMLVNKEPEMKVSLLFSPFLFLLIQGKAQKNFSLNFISYWGQLTDSFHIKSIIIIYTAQ